MAPAKTTLPSCSLVKLKVCEVVVPPVITSLSPEPVVGLPPLNVRPPDGIGFPVERSTVTVSLPRAPLKVRVVIGVTVTSNERVFLSGESVPPRGAAVNSSLASVMLRMFPVRLILNWLFLPTTSVSVMAKSPPMREAISVSAGVGFSSHSSAPEIPSLALKKKVPLTYLNEPGPELPLPGLISMIVVPASVPLLDHSSLPLVPSSAVK